MPTPAVEIVGLSKAYKGVRAVDGLDLTAALGAVTAVLGPNGAGKTTTVEICEGLRTPDAGKVRILGMDPATRSSLLRSRVGVMLQDGGLPASARATDVLRHVAAMYASPRDLRELQERLGLGTFARTTVRRLSGGQRQRLALACALVGRPELAFLDEPTSGLDPQGRHAVWDLVADLRSAGVGIVLTTHRMDEAEALADHVAILDRGQVIAEGAPADLVAHRRADGLRFLGPPTLASAMTRDLGPQGIQVREEAPGAYVATVPAIPGRGPDAATSAAIAALSSWGAERGALLTGFGSGRRTLEDVFLELTGRSLR